MSKSELKAKIDQYKQLYTIAYKAWEDTKVEACKEEAKYYWSQFSKAVDKYMEMD